MTSKLGLSQGCSWWAVAKRLRFPEHQAQCLSAKPCRMGSAHPECTMGSARAMPTSPPWRSPSRPAPPLAPLSAAAKTSPSPLLPGRDPPGSSAAGPAASPLAPQRPPSRASARGRSSAFPLSVGCCSPSLVPPALLGLRSCSAARGSADALGARSPSRLPPEAGRASRPGDSARRRLAGRGVSLLPRSRGAAPVSRALARAMPPAVPLRIPTRCFG